jgi:hypothetical protein
MKQLTKEQHEAICQWLNKNNITITEVDQQGTSDTYFASHKFRQDFEKSCCESCTDGETCESDPSLSAFQVFTEAYDESKAKVDKIVKENLDKRFTVSKEDLDKLLYMNFLKNRNKQL